MLRQNAKMLVGPMTLKVGASLLKFVSDERGVGEKRVSNLLQIAPWVGVLFGYFLWFFWVFFMVFRSADASQSVSEAASQSVG